ncbi:uncharacterized protein LOC129966792 [Argiope bruennichi]|uniref:uncharacterized protein LOC129966792 n=1 Tax=Argiope bruennichi TaxID=94029 RepID=UPI002494E626|nr:uncharacterized protein LOC129966792 [Argiope bruennichi]
MCLVLLNAFSTLSLLLLPPIGEKTQGNINIRLKLANRSQAISIPLSLSMQDECVREMTRHSEINCSALQSESPSQNGTTDEIVKEIQVDHFQDIDFRMLRLIHLNNSNNINITFSMHLPSRAIDSSNFSNINQTHILHFKCEPHLHLCTFQANTSINEYKTYQFWAFACLVIIAGLASGNINSLSDVVCYEILDEQRHLYGRQRLFGTIGWALSCLVSGYLSDLATGNSPRKDYSPGFYVMICLMLLDTFIISKLPLNKELKLSTNIYRDVKKVFHSSEVILFAIGSVMMGAFTAAIAYYELWYLQDLGASQSLLGWTIIVQCLIAETPFFVISGWFVKKFGSFNCLIGSFAAYALRFGCYSIITNPWWALLVDLTHGFTFAMFHAAMTHFVSVNAPEGIEGTMFGIFGGLIDGMGQASGSLLCGAGFDKFGGRFTFTIASIFSGSCAVVFLIFSRCLAKFPKRTVKENIFLEKQSS